MARLGDITIKLLDDDLKKIVKLRCTTKNCIHNRDSLCNLKNIWIEDGKCIYMVTELNGILSKAGPGAAG